MGVTRGKRFSRSNIIGEKGELLFRDWALNRQLIANKATMDIGIDFFCQVAKTVSGSTSLEALGPILEAQVKTVGEGENARLTLNRIDATDLLRQTQATCLFGIRLSDKSVRFQFLDRSFIDQLVEFLDGNNKQLTISYKSLSNDMSLFLRLLNRYTNPFEQNQLRIHLIQQRLKSGIPGSQLSIESTDEETISKVSVPWVTSAFSIDPKAMKEARLKFLREGDFDPEQEGVELHPAIGQAIRTTCSSMAEVRGTSTVPVRVKVRFAGASAVESFDYREFRTEKTFVHRSGLRITMDRATVQLADGHHHHPMESEVFRPNSATPVAGRALVFFRLFRPGAIIELQPGWEAPLETFGSSLTSIGAAVDAWPDLCNALKLELRRLSLSDLLDEEFSRTAWLLDALLIREFPVGALANGFLVGPAADRPPNEVPTEPAIATVPICMNWKGVGIVIWLECQADVFLWEESVCGIRLKKHSSWRIEKTKRFEKSIYPEMWFRKDWPAVPLREGLGGVSTWNYDGVPRHPFEAIVRRVRTSPSEE